MTHWTDLPKAVYVRPVKSRPEYLGDLETSKRRKGHNMTVLRKGWKQSIEAINAILELRAKQNG